MSEWPGPEPNEPITELTAYSTPTPKGPIDLELAGNEGSTPPQAVLEALAELEAEQLRRYPDLTDLRDAIASKHGVDSDRVLLTAGGDQSIDLLARTFLTQGRRLLTHEPSFVMIERAGRLAGGQVRTVDWTRGAFPVEPFIEARDEDTSLAVVVTPNNPTGATLTESDLRTLAAELSPTLLVIDHAYVEFADVDLTDVCLELDNVAVIRTFSKAYGLAGTRVGYLLGPSQLVDWLKRIRSPYPIATPSIVAATTRLQADDDVEEYIERVREHRTRLRDHLDALGVMVYPSEANFVLGAYPDARWVFDGLAGLGIRTRLFPGRANLADHLRITVPGEPFAIDRLEQALCSVLTPEAIIFDLDGVLADVSGSYRSAVIETAADYGLDITHSDIEERKHAGEANNDWEVTHGFLEDAGIEVEFDEVKETFQAHYFGEGVDHEPFYQREQLLNAQALSSLSDEITLAIVTGRPREDADRFLESTGIDHHFETVICMEDAPNKPAPEPVLLALERLDVSHAWMIGDTPDDIRAARYAGVVPLGIVPPESDPDRTEQVLLAAGGARVMTELEELLDLLETATTL